MAERDFKFPKNIKPSLVITVKKISMNDYYSKFNKGIKVKTTEGFKMEEG